MATVTESTEVASMTAPHPTLKVYNTLSKKKEPFTTVQPGKVGMYLCGPTVYDKAHIGHMVGPVIFDCIKRYLVYNGYDVTWVVNITDVDDKLINKASERNISMLDVAEENIADYHQNLAGLGVDQIDQFPRATESMDEIIRLIESLIEREHAYESEGDVYFAVPSDPDYGKLSNRSLDAIQGEGGEGSGRKRHPADFALWKRAKAGEPSWESPWGKGRPGWHIECSAMSRQLLGKTFDIHGGGLDLVFPHHENELAQSESCHDAPMVSYWMHNGLLRADPEAGKIGGRGDREAQATAGGGKMSRSEGAGGLHELIATQGGERIRFFLLRTHYRSTVLFSEPAIEEAGVGLETFHRFFKRFERVTGKSFYALPAAATREAGQIAAGDDPTLQAARAAREKFLAAMDDDFNTGSAIGDLFDLVRTLNKFCDQAKLEGPGQGDAARLETLERSTAVLRELASILGLFVVEPGPSAENSDEAQLVGGLVQLLIDLRNQARKNKDFATADGVRDGLKDLGVVLEDRPGGTEWSRG